jgi:hypothetical protein
VVSTSVNIEAQTFARPSPAPQADGVAKERGRPRDGPAADADWRQREDEKRYDIRHISRRIRVAMFQGGGTPIKVCRGDDPGSERNASLG